LGSKHIGIACGSLTKGCGSEAFPFCYPPPFQLRSQGRNASVCDLIQTRRFGGCQQVCFTSTACYTRIEIESSLKGIWEMGVRDAVLPSCGALTSARNSFNLPISAPITNYCLGKLAVWTHIITEEQLTAEPLLSAGNKPFGNCLMLTIPLPSPTILSVPDPNSASSIRQHESHSAQIFLQQTHSQPQARLHRIYIDLLPKLLPTNSTLKTIPSPTAVFGLDRLQGLLLLRRSFSHPSHTRS
jgi:hypothetical protein